MEDQNNNPQETVAAAEPTPAPTPDATKKAPETSKAAAAPTAPATPVKMELPKTTGTTPGGWNRFADPKRTNNKFKPKGNRDGFRGRH
ncbi:MAG TPA: hypothetical protein VHE12_03225 [bacterium]|nr:hypothetical protein [bacterium]